MNHSRALALALLLASVLVWVAARPLAELWMQAFAAHSLAPFLWLVRAGALGLAGLAVVVWRWPQAIPAGVRGVIAAPLRLDAWSFFALVLALIGAWCLLGWLALRQELVTDSLWFHRAAQIVAEHGALRVDDSVLVYRYPGYPWLLGTVYRAVGDWPALAWLPGTLAAMLQLVLIYDLARRYVSGDAARWAVLLLLAYPTFPLYWGLVMSDVAFGALLMLFLWLLLRIDKNGPAWLVIGLLWGSMTLLRGQGLIFGTVLLLWVLARQRGDWLRGGGVALLGMLLVVAPWAMRNYLVFGHAVLANNLGVNASLSVGRDTPLPADILAIDNVVERSQAEADLAMARVVDDPLLIIRRAPAKLADFFLSEPSATQMWWQSTGPAWLARGLRLASELSAKLILLLAAWRLIVDWRRWNPLQQATVVLLLAHLALTVAFFGADRFRLPLMPLLSAMAAMTLVRGVNRDPRFRGPRLQN